MGSRQWIFGIALVCLLPRAAAAQWTNPKLIAGQVGFNVAVSFVGKLILQRESPGLAFKKSPGRGERLRPHGPCRLHDRWPTSQLGARGKNTRAKI